MDWTNQKVLKFLELYQMHPCIWDPNHSSHKNKVKLNAAWNTIQNNMGEPCTIMELKKKRESLMSAFRGYKTKIKKSETATGTSEVYKPIWFAYEYMNSFLGDIYKCNLTTNNEDNRDLEILNTSQNDMDNIIFVTDSYSTNPEEECSNMSHSSQGSSMNQRYSTNTPKVKTKFKRKQHDPSKLQHIERKMHQAFDILKTVAEPEYKEEDECSIFGKLVATKMRKLKGDRRDLMMIKINQLFYDERQEHIRPHSSASSSMLSHQRTPSPQLKIEVEKEMLQ